MELSLITIGRGIVVLIGIIAAAISLLAAINKYKVSKKKKILLDNKLSSQFVAQFGKGELTRHLLSYVIPHCSPSDPANKEGEEYLAEIRESIFDYIDRTITSSGKSYQLLLADTGMGKTTFCLNYLAYAKNKFPELNFALVSLASKSSDSHISSVPSKADTVLIADAFDEDPNGWGRGRDRLSELLEKCEDFKAVIITCRSQYFLSDDAIPRETPLAVLVPRTLGQGQVFNLIRSYISPFGPEEITRYIDHRFPRLYFWRWHSRRKARALVKAIPDLAHRPMLLERLPELVRQKITSNELYDLYYVLIEGWLERESRWIESGRLRAISIELAVVMYREFRSRRGRLQPEEIRQIAVNKLGDSPDWTHLTSRSLLNRDSRGFFKFAHKSILEFLVVRAAIEGDDRALSVEWTDFMKEVLVSWGHSKAGRAHTERASEMLMSPGGRANITPLYDPLDAAPVKGLPDFQRCAERRRTHNGYRLAPADWRASSIDVQNKDGRGIITISDADYDLDWTYVASRDGFELVRLLQILEKNKDFKPPSYEQFVSLIEGLSISNQDIIPDGMLFLIGDKPGRRENLLVQLNSDISDSQHLKIVDKQRRISGTNVYINCYRTGISVSPAYANKLRVGNLYLNRKDYEPFL